MITYHEDLIQGSDAWLQARCGLLTASEMHLIITPTLKVADNDKSRSHMNELLAQRISGYVEPHYISDDMLRGQEDEIEAMMLYAEKYAAWDAMGFITNDKWGFKIGFSPDGLVGARKIVEVKGRRQKFQVGTIIDGAMPPEYLIQVQTGLLVSERDECDFISYSGGWPMAVISVAADPLIQEAIVKAASAFEAKLAERHAQYAERSSKYFPTKRRVEMEVVL